MKKRILKRKLLACLLAVSMMCTTVAPVFASETSPQVYDPAVLEQLTAIAGDTSKSPEEKLNQLIEMGLITQQDIDEAKQGTVSDTEAAAGVLGKEMGTLNIDGENMTLDDIREMLAQPGIDLNQKVNIDGITVTLQNLKTMVEIEDQIQKIAASFIDPETLEPEFKTAYDSILNQMRTDGLVLAADTLELLPNPGDGNSVAYDHDARIAIGNGGAYEVTTGDREVALTFTLSKQLPYAVSFDYRTADGNAAAGINYTEKSGTVVFEPNQTEQTITIELADNDTLIETTPGEWWAQNKTFLVELSNAKNALFENGFRNASVRVDINSEYWHNSFATNHEEIFIRGEAVVSFNDQTKTLQPGNNGVSVPGGRLQITAKYPVEITKDQEKLEKLRYEIDAGFFDTLHVDMYRGYADNGTHEYWGIDEKSVKISTADGTQLADMTISSDAEKKEPESGKSSIYFSLTDEWKQDVFNWGTLTVEHMVKYNTGQDSTYVNGTYFDNAFPPVVEAVTIPDGTYYPGQLVPVTVTYDSPVYNKGDYKASATINGTKVISSIRESDYYSNKKGLSKKLTYLYEVKENDLPYITVESISGGYDTGDHGITDNTSRELTGAKISTSREKAIASIQTDKESYSPAGDEGYIEIGLNTDYSQWLEGGGADAVKVSIDGGATLYDVEYKRDASGTASDDTLITTVPVKFPANADEQAKSVRAELFLEDTDAAGHHSVLMGVYRDVNIRAAQYPTAISIDPDCYPKDNITYFRNPPTMKAVTEPAADTLEPVPVFNWSSNNPDVADIDPTTGEIQPKTEGTVTFTVTTTGKEGAELKAVTEEITVMDGGEPFLEAPGQITTSIQTDTTVAWSTNAISKNSKKNPPVDTVFTIKVIDTESGQEVHQETVTTNAEESKTAVVIPGSVLTKISSSGQAAYKVIITCTDPVHDDRELKAESDIVTRALPVVVRLEGVENYYITDENPHVSFEAMFQNGDTQNGLAYDYKVVKNGQPFKNYAEAETGYKDASKSFSFDVDKVDNKALRDIYIVSIEANNPGDSPSTDSFILYVYRSGSMDISVDGVNDDNLTLNNNTKSDIAKTTTEDISGLRERANLKSMLSIHRDGLDWSNVDDQIAWNTSSDNVASINYQQNGFYANINDYEYTSYRPSSEFMLVGHSDGETVITATHAKTGEQTQLNVDVTTLKDKLYVFNFLPRQRTEVKYTNGKGEEKTLYTNDQGEIAIYEEYGISGDIELTSGEGEDLYMSTLRDQKLVSSEGNPSKMELYPVNTFKLKPAAKIELYLVTESGDTYEGDLSISGAVYKNNKICPETEIRDQKMTLTAADQGRLVISGMDPETFWTEKRGETLRPSDQMDYVFIARTPNDEYYPLYIKVDGSLSADESVVFTANAMTMKKVPAGRENKPFIASMSARFNNVSSNWSQVLDYHDLIGISELTPEMELNTTVLWWGEENANNSDHTVQIEDEYGRLLNNQKTSDITRYLFSDIAVSENNIVLGEDNSGLEAGGTMRPRLKLKKSGQLVLAQDTAFTFMNGIGLPDIESDAGLQDALDNMLDDSYKTDTSSDKYSEGGDMVAPGSKNLLSSLDATFNDLGLGMLLSPTNNPTVWKFFIEIGGDFMGDSKSENKIMVDQSADKTNFLPGPLDAYRMITGTYKENEMGNLKDALRTGTGKEAAYGAKLGGFYEGIITYKNGKWEMRTRSGGFTYGLAGGYTWSVNTLVGPIPITASASIGGGLEMDHKILMTEHGSGDNKEYLQNLLVTMRINAYIKAFVGIGFDISVLALKFGVFGQVDLSNYNMFLDYRDDSGKLHSISGQKVDFTGKVGIEFYLKILFIKYRKILASTSFTAGKTFNDWDDIVEWQKEANFPSDFGGYDTDTAAMMMTLASMPEFETLAEGMYIEDRNYLELADRVWGEPSGGIQPMSLDDHNKLENLQSNSYPYANPLVSNDGKMVVFLSDASSEDLDMTRVEYSIMKDGMYQAPNVVSESPYADSNLQFADSGDTKIAVWQRQSKNLAFEPGQTATDDDLNAMMNASEICAAIYNEEGDSWTTTQLTENGMADMAPVVATNGEKAVVVWRRVASTTTENVAAMEFDARNDLLYRVWDGDAWSEEKTIYNGTSGSIKGLSAAMDEEGNTIITYAIDSSSYVGKVEMAAFATEQENQKLDVVYSIIDNENNLTNSTIFLTKDEYIDENPQVTTVMLDGQERFIAGWYTQRPLSDAQDDTAVSDIQLRVINSDGSLYNNFANSINEINNNTSVTISNRFRFARTNSKDINDLALVWIAPEMEYLEEVNPAEADMDRDSLYALRFYQKSEGEQVYVSAAIPIVTEEENNKIDHADAYLPDGGETICAVLQTTAYDLSNPDLQEHIELDEKDAEGKPVVITVATPISAMKTATGEFKNSAKIGDPIFDYASVRHDNILPIQLTVTNQGVDPIDSVSVTTTDENGGTEQKREFKDLNLMPNASTILTVYHPLAGEGQLIQNISYSASVTFDGETPETIAPITGLAEVQIPDVGINTIETVNENQHQRDIQVKLYNQSDIELERLAEQGYKAYIGFYSDNLCNTPASGISLLSYDEVSAQADQNEFEIPQDRLYLIDNGALICNFRYALPTDFANGDQTLYAKVWVEKNGEEITEAYTANNEGSVVFTDPVARNNGNPILLTSELSADASGNTTADITVKNLSWNAVPADGSGGGNLIVTLIDSDGTTLETQQSLLNDGDLLTLEGEQEITKTFQFSKPGAEVRLSYVQVSDEETDASLSDLTINGVPLRFDRDTLNYEVNAENLFHAEIKATTSNPNAAITAKRVVPESEDILTSQKGVLSGKLALELGQSGTTTQNVIELTVTSVAGTEQKYIVKINNTSINHNKVEVEVPAFMNQAGEKTVGISLKDFEGAPVSFTTKVDGGEKKGPFAWIGGSQATAAVDVPDIEGEHSITIEVLDDHGFVTAATANVLVDKTAPVIDEQNIRFEETDIPLFKNPFDMNALLPNPPSETDGVTDHQLKVHLKASDALSGMERVTANAGGREYEAVKNEDGSYTATITYSFRGPLRLTAYDKAGNSSETSRDVNIDDELPVGEFSTGTAVVTQTEAKLFASVGTRDEFLSECGIEYRKQTDTEWTRSVLTDLSQKEDFYVTINPIESGAEYVYRVFVRDVIGNVHYGETKSFQAPDGDKTVNGFYVEGQLGEAVIDNTAHTITVTMPYHTDLEALKEKLPYVTQFIVSKNAVVEMLSAEIVDNTLRAIYRITAENETSEEYTLTIQLQSAPVIDHGCFDSIANADAGIHPTIISGSNLENARQIEILLYDSNNLIASRAVVEKRDEDYIANIPVPENTDIENAKVYTIAYIIDGIETVTEQTVTVERALNNQCELLEFRIQEAQSIDINHEMGTIHVTIPYDYAEDSIPVEAVVSKDAAYTINGTADGRLTVEGDSELKITSGTGEEKIYTVTVTRAAIPQVHLMTFQTQPYNKESRVAVKVDGTDLANAGEIKVIATAQDDPNITVSAVAGKSGADTYMAMLTIPDNFKLFEDRVFKLSAEVDGVAQVELDISQKDIIQPKNNNVIESFTIENAASDAVITHNDNTAEGTIEIVMNYDADLTNLSPVIKLRDGVTLTPEATDFTNPVVYTLSSANHADRTYTVSVTKTDIPAVTGLRFTPFTSSKAGEITVTVEGDKIDSLQLPLVITASNGDDKIEGEVTQTDGVYSAVVNIPENTDSTAAAQWKLTLTENGKQVPLPETILYVQPALNITAFTIPGQLSSSVDGNTIKVVMPKGKDLTALVPEITFTPDASITPALGTAVNFSEDVEYTLTLGSDTTAYKITVTTKAGGGGSIGGGGGSAITSYTVTFETNGGSKIDNVKVTRNAAVDEPKEPTKDDYTFEGWFTDKDCTKAYDFDSKVTKNITLYAKWTEDKEEPTEPTEPSKWENPFTDIDTDDWYYEDVKFAEQNGLFSGTTETTFTPDGLITRAMLVTALWRNEKQPVVNYLMAFDDVADNAYYAEAVRWAASVGIVKGYSDTEFAPDQNITREQIAAIMHRYATHKGYDVSAGENTNILSYTDAGDISEYAIPSVQYAVGSGLMKGKTESTLCPPRKNRQ